MSGVLLGLMMFAQVPPPYNEGLYRCVTVDMGPKGTLCNAQEPAPHANCTTTPMETLTDAVRKAFEAAAPDRVCASWGHASGINIAGIDPETEPSPAEMANIKSVVEKTGVKTIFTEELVSPETAEAVAEDAEAAADSAAEEITSENILAKSYAAAGSSAKRATEITEEE